MSAPVPVQYGEGVGGFSDQELVESLELNLWGMWSEFSRGPGCQLYNSDGALWFDTPIPLLPYNGVLRFVVDDDIDRRIDVLFDHYRTRAMPFVWLVHPTSLPEDLGERLGARGLEMIEECPGMAAVLDDLPEPQAPPEGIEIREVTIAEADRLLELVAWRWDVPAEAAGHLKMLNRRFRIGTGDAKVRCWMAWRGDDPVARVVLHPAVGSAGLYGLATVPEARGLGLARNLTLNAFAAAREAGYRLGVLHSTPMAFDLFSSLGFRAVAPFFVYGTPGELHR